MRGREEGRDEEIQSNAFENNISIHKRLEDIMKFIMSLFFFLSFASSLADNSRNKILQN